MIGAGLAGLTAANDLVKRGYDVVVLEAQARPGGRILTIRAPFSEELYVEAGATHVVGDPDLLSLFAETGVEVKRLKPPRGLATIAYAGGRRTRYAPDDDPPESPGLTDEERKLGFEGCLAKYFGDVKGADPGTLLSTRPPSIAAADRQTGAELLSARGASPAYARSFANDFVPEDAGAVSGAYVLLMVAGFFQDFAREGGGRAVGGTDRLPKALAERLGPRVLYGAEVTRIATTEHDVTVTYVRAGETRTVAAERAVCAVPYTVLRHLAIDGVSPEKARAIRELSSISIARAFVEVDRRVWLERGESGDAETDLSIGGVHDETKLQPGRAGVLGAFLTGDRARRLEALRETERVRELVDDVELVHPGVKAALRATLTKCWDEDPFARGAFASYRPGQVMELAPAIARADGRLHFAGDHTSARPGWMHGAVASAKRVVREIEGA